MGVPVETVDENEPSPLDVAKATLDRLGVGDHSFNDPDAPKETPVETAMTDPEEEVEPEGQPRDEQGRFTKKEEETPAAEETPEEEGEYLELEFSDPRVAAYLEQHGGDLEKALATAIEAQSLIGRQSSEVSEARRALEQVEALKTLMLMQQAQAAQPQAPPITADEIEADPAAAAQRAYQIGDFQALDRAVREWHDIPGEEFAAQSFANGIVMQYQIQQALEANNAQWEQKLAAQQQPQGDPAAAAVIAKYPDMEQRLPAMSDVLRSRPDLRNILESEQMPSEARAAVLESVYHLAGGQQDAGSLQRELVKKARIQTREDAQAARAGARVVSTSQNRGAGQEAGVDLFRRHFLAATGQDLEE